MAKVKRQNMRIVQRENGDFLILQRPAFVAAEKKTVAAKYLARVKDEARSFAKGPSGT